MASTPSVSSLFLAIMNLADNLDYSVGQNSGKPRQTNGIEPNNQNDKTALPFDFVVSKGGAYFFVPSISALQKKFAV